MSDLVVPKISKWPFFVGDFLLLGMAGLVLWQGASPLVVWEMLVMAICVGLGAGLGVTPFILEYQHFTKLAQVERLQRSLLQVHKIETVGRQIASATASWQAVQDEATKSVEAARQINESMTAEAHAFQAFLEKANSSERQHLRLEVDKLRRAEADWLRVSIRILDHVYALSQAAFRSGQSGLIEQISTFQRACRDSAMRVGLVAVEANAGDAYDAQLHQWDQDNIEPPPGRIVVETLATGFRFQGQTIRRALVSLEAARTEPSPLSMREIAQHREESHHSIAAIQPAESDHEPEPETEPEGESESARNEEHESDPWRGFVSPVVSDDESQ